MLKPQHEKRFFYLVKALNTLIDDVQEYCPEANYYLANNMLNLMSGPSHSVITCAPLQDNVAVAAPIRTAGGGDW